MLRHGLSLIFVVVALFQHSAAIPETLEDATLDRRQGRGRGFEELQRIYQDYESETQRLMQESGGQCNDQNIVVRREWGNMDPGQRERYIQAVYCLQNSPSRLQPGDAPGAHNRRDDFTMAHMQNTQKVHFSPWLLVFHRHFVWLYEQALCNECGYCEGQPYWDWPKYLDQPLQMNPLLDGSPTSLGSDGATTPDNNCSCVQRGPFSDIVVTLGPIAGGIGCRANPRDDGLGDNPRCLERKFNTESIGGLSYDNCTEAMTQHNDIISFSLRIEQWPGGLHPIPHEVIGGNQDDIPSSPADPWFWCHHTALDRFWAIWQSRDYSARKSAIPPPEIYKRFRDVRNWRPAEDVTLEDNIYISGLWDRLPVREAMSTVGGRYCYIYD